VLKTLAAFMNSYGGTLIVGVDDDGGIVGIDQDFALLKKPDRDGWELWLTDAASHVLGKAAAAEMLVRIAVIDGRHVARIDTGPASEPVFAKPHDAPNKPAFLVRTNNSTQELAGQEALSYQKSRWPS
jgi:predicted HTH transcriptional regulator